jgi:hypothetical protein
MARLVVSLVFLGIYLIVWLIKKAGNNDAPRMTGGYTPPASFPSAGNRPPAPLQLPAGNNLLLSASTTYRELDEVMIIAAFMRTAGPPDGEPATATWRRGAVEIKYAFDAAAGRRELTFSGEGAEAARQQVAGKVTWLKG